MSAYKFNSRSGKLERRRTNRRRFFALGARESFVGWEAQDVSADSALYPQLVQLVARARDLERSNDYIRSFLRLLKANVIGAYGVKLTACRKARNGRIDKAFNTAVEKAWRASGKLRHSPTVCGRLTRKDIGDMLMTRLAVDGEALVVERMGFPGNRWRYALQLLDSMRLDWRVNGQLPNGNRAKMGVEVDDDDRPLAYHILKMHPSEGLFGWQLNQPEFERIPAERVWHIYVAERPGQTRGVTWLAAPGLRARMLDKFEEAICVGARVAASKMGFYKPTEDYEDDLPGEETEAVLRQEVEPGMLELLPRGLDLDTFDPNFPPANLEEFHKVISRGIASGLGGNYSHMFSNYEGVNYSSLREAKLTDRDFWRALQRFYVDHFEEVWFGRWAQAQQLNEASGLDPGKLEALVEEDCYRFTPRGWQWVDPLKEVNANVSAIAAGLTSPQRIIEETSGEDPEVILDEIAEFMEIAAAKGAVLSYAEPEKVPPSE